MVDAADLKSVVRKDVGVQVPPGPPFHIALLYTAYGLTVFGFLYAGFAPYFCILWHLINIPHIQIR